MGRRRGRVIGWWRAWAFGGREWHVIAFRRRCMRRRVPAVEGRRVRVLIVVPMRRRTASMDWRRRRTLAVEGRRRRTLFVEGRRRTFAAEGRPRVPVAPMLGRWRRRMIFARMRRRRTTMVRRGWRRIAAEMPVLTYNRWRMLTMGRIPRGRILISQRSMHVRILFEVQWLTRRARMIPSEWRLVPAERRRRGRSVLTEWRRTVTAEWWSRTIIAERARHTFVLMPICLWTMFTVTVFRTAVAMPFP